MSAETGDEAAFPIHSSVRPLTRKRLYSRKSAPQGDPAAQQIPIEPSEFSGLIFVRYFDHVQYNRSSALVLKPQVREAVGWLVYDCDQYVTLTWDRDAEPPTLRGGDPKASGLVLLKSDILELKRLA